MRTRSKSKQIPAQQEERNEPIRDQQQHIEESKEPARTNQNLQTSIIDTGKLASTDLEPSVE